MSSVTYNLTEACGNHPCRKCKQPIREGDEIIELYIVVWDRYRTQQYCLKCGTKIIKEKIKDLQAFLDRVQAGVVYLNQSFAVKVDA